MGLWIWLAQSESPEDVLSGEIDNILNNAPTTPGEALDLVVQKFESLWTGFLLSLPIILIGIVVFLIGFMLAAVLSRAFARGLDRTSTDPVVGRLLARIARTILIIGALLFALSVMGVSVGNAVTFLAVLGFAVGLAIQGILENFVAGIILLVRKPFRAGDQVIVGEHEGTVEDIDFRVTTIVSYDGTTQLIPNGQVYANPITNLTGRGSRRSTLAVGVDYRDDHDAAREVIRSALEQVDGVLADPACEVLLTELGDSSVNFELRYWTEPSIRAVRHTQDRVLSAVKSAIEGAGMTIPWPIRTLVVDGDSDIRVDPTR